MRGAAIMGEWAAWAAIFALLLASAAYFAFHAALGPHGWFALQSAERRIVGLRNQAAVLTEQEAAMRANVARLRPETLDLDLLDERMRATLGYLRRDEAILSPP